MRSDPKGRFYCARDERLTKIPIEICGPEASTPYLRRDQTYRGRCVVALDAHETERFHLDRDTRHRSSRDVARAAAALQRALGPDKIHYAILGDLPPHLYHYVLPKYRNGPGWGQPPALHSPVRRCLPEEGDREIIGATTAHLSRGWVAGAPTRQMGISAAC